MLSLWLDWTNCLKKIIWNSILEFETKSQKSLKNKNFKFNKLLIRQN